MIKKSKRLNKKQISRITLDTCRIGANVERTITIYRGPTHKADRRNYMCVSMSSWRRWRAIQEAMVQP